MLLQIIPVSFLQCCESGMTYSGSSYDFSEFWIRIKTFWIRHTVPDPTPIMLNNKHLRFLKEQAIEIPIQLKQKRNSKIFSFSNAESVSVTTRSGSTILVIWILKLLYPIFLCSRRAFLGHGSPDVHPVRCPAPPLTARVQVAVSACVLDTWNILTSPPQLFRVCVAGGVTVQP